MSGHSHWSQVKHKKAASDVKKGQIRSKLMNAIYIALKEGSNPEINGKLRTAIERARDFGISQDTIERAINKPEKTNIEEVIYEVYGQAGTAFLIKAQTDNKNRTTGEIKHLISNFGKLAEPGSVLWLFEEKGMIEISREDFEEKLIDDFTDFGLEDFKEAIDEDGDKIIMLITEPRNIFELKKAVESKKIKIKSCEVRFLPKNLINLKNIEQESLNKFIEKILDHPDVLAIYANYNNP
jgi:YebC/PmpR family DNA-binding regulatory protein